jgi:hypothetical protein
MRIEVINFLPTKFDSDMLFELPLVCKPMGVSKQMQGMEKKYDDHAWCKVKITNIKNSFRLGFRSAKRLGHLWCQNDSRYVFFQSCAHSENNWSDDSSQVLLPAKLSHLLPLA